MRNRPEGFACLGRSGLAGHWHRREPRGVLGRLAQYAIASPLGSEPCHQRGTKAPYSQPLRHREVPRACLSRHLRHRGAPDPRCEENKAGETLVARGNHSKNTSLVSFLFSYTCPYWLNSQSTYLLLKEFHPKRSHHGNLPLMTCTEVVQHLGGRMRRPLPSELSRPPKRRPAHGPYREAQGHSRLCCLLPPVLTQATTHTASSCCLNCLVYLTW